MPPAAAPRHVTDILEEVQSLAPLIRDNAEAQERARRISPEVIPALHRARLMRLWLPGELDGDELSLPDALRVFEAASTLDGATGWAVTIGTGGNVFAGYLEPAAREHIFGPADAVIAGSGSPTGTARPADGGYVVSGKWQYASGAQYATWFTANCVIEAPGETGTTQAIRAMAMPAEVVTLDDDWDAFGMSATGSVRFSVADVFVRHDHTFSVFDDDPLLAHAVYGYPFQGVAETSFAAVALGVARHAIDAFVGLAGHRDVRPGAAKLLDVPDTVGRISEAEATLRSARAWFASVVGESWAEFEATGALDARGAALVTLASTFAAQSAVRAADLLYAVAGTSPVLGHSEFGRAWRDVHVVSQHVMLSPQNYQALGALFDRD